MKHEMICKEEKLFPLGIHLTQNLDSSYLDQSVSQSVSSVIQLGPNFCEPRDCSTTGLPVHDQLSELTQTHVH